MCGMGFQITVVEHALIAVSQLSATGNRVTFSARGVAIENITTGRIMTLVRRGGIDVLRIWIATSAQGFLGPQT